MKTKQHRYQLEPYKHGKSKHICPKCNNVKPKTFTRYIDIETGLYLNNDVGKCDRESKCNYHYKPKEYFENTGAKHQKQFIYREIEPPKPISYLPQDLINTNYKENYLYCFLTSIFERDKVDQVMEMYRVGSSDKWQYSTIFYQIDKYGNYRTGKVMQYNQLTGKRIKKPFNKIGWQHSTNKNYNLEQCLFGSHLARLNDTKHICIVESEKTALIMAIVEPKYIWLATGGLCNLQRSKLCFNGRKITLFPDSKCAGNWAKKVNGILNVNVSRDLETFQEGTDLADLVLEELSSK